MHRAEKRGRRGIVCIACFVAEPEFQARQISPGVWAVLDMADNVLFPGLTQYAARKLRWKLEAEARGAAA